MMMRCLLAGLAAATQRPSLNGGSRRLTHSSAVAGASANSYSFFDGYGCTGANELGQFGSTASPETVATCAGRGALSLQRTTLRTSRHPAHRAHPEHAAGVAIRTPHIVRLSGRAYPRPITAAVPGNRWSAAQRQMA